MGTLRAGALVACALAVACCALAVRGYAHPAEMDARVVPVSSLHPMLLLICPAMLAYLAELSRGSSGEGPSLSAGAPVC